jgi:hypothetical protein
MVTDRILQLSDFPALCTKLEDATGLLHWRRLVYSHEYQPCFLTVAGRTVMLPAVWYLDDARALAHYLPLPDAIDKERLRAVYKNLRCVMLAVRRAPESESPGGSV